MKPSYGYERRPLWRGSITRSMVNRLILANVAVFFLQQIFGPSFDNLFALQPRLVIAKFFLWQPVTYMFLHGSFMHLFFNMLMTWFIGTALESVWGGKRFLKYWIACGVGGALFFAIFNFTGAEGVVGASAGVFGLYLAYAMMFPNNYVYVYFLFPVKAKYLVTFAVIFQLAQGIAGQGGIAYFAHLGGMAAGLFFFRHEVARWQFWTRMKRQWIDQQRVRNSKWGEQENGKIDSILDKIASKGYENLSTTEKRILENYSRKQKEDSE